MNLLASRKRLLRRMNMLDYFLWSYGGYLIVSTLCDLCGVTLDKNNARGFVADCIESLHDTLKANLSMNGTNYSLSLNDELVSEFIDFYLNVRKYEMGNSYVKSLEEYKSKYENEPSRIILDSSIVNIKTKWKKEDTDIYIPNGNVENLPNGVKILYGLWVYNTGDQFIEITGGWESYHDDTNWFWSGSCCYKGDIEETYLSFSIKQDKSMCSLATSNKINFKEVNKIKITYSRIANTNAIVPQLHKETVRDDKILLKKSYQLHYILQT